MAVLCWSSREEIPQAQGKRNSSKMVGVARGQQRADTLKTYSQKTSQSNHTRTTAFSNSMKPSHACGQPKMSGSWWRGLTDCGPLEKGMANHFSILALIPHAQYEKAKLYDTERGTPQVSRCPICYWKSVEK